MTRMPNINRRSFVAGTAAIGGGFALSFLYWAAQIFKWGIDGFLHLRGAEFKTGWVGEYALQKYNFWNEVINYLYFTRIECIAIGGLFAWLHFAKRERLLRFLCSRWTQAIVYTLTIWRMVTPGVSIGTRIIDCCLCFSAFGSDLPMKIAIVQRGSPAPEVHHLRPLRM